MNNHPSPPPVARPDIFSHLDYREYLVAMYVHARSSSRHFSERAFARLSGLASSYPRMVMQGKRKLTVSSAAKFARGFKLSRAETAYLEWLVLYQHAPSDADRDRYLGQMLKLRPKPRAQGLRRDQLEYVTDSLYAIVREMSVLPGFNADPEWIAARLYRHATPLQIRHVLEVLERLELLKRDKSGRLRHTMKALETPSDTNFAEYVRYYREILAETRRAIALAPHDEWDASSKTIAIAKEILPEAMALLRRFQSELDELLQSGPRKFHEVYQINMQIFPVTRMKR